MKRISYNNKTRANSDEVIDLAVETLRNGGLIVFPTETCYGLGADATNPDAVQKLFKYKGRREGKPLSIAVTGKEMAAKYVEINDIAENLYDNYLPGPVTVVSKSIGNVAPGVESEMGTVGIRVPAYDLILDIVRKLDRPMTATSANISYGDKPYNVDKLLKETPEKQRELLDLIIDAGELPKNQPSTVVDTTLNNLNIMREGSLKFNEAVTKSGAPILSATTNSADDTIAFGAMAMLKNIDAMIDQPLVFALSGELGAGKTQFVKGLAKQLKIQQNIDSPTYTIINEYPFSTGGVDKGLLMHADTWRIGDANELERMNFARYLVKNNVVAIEWVDKFYTELESLFKKSNAMVLNVKVEHVSETSRKFSIYV